MSLQRNSALSMRIICFSKPVSELVLQTGLTRPRSWTEEMSDLGRGLFSFEFPAHIETSASRELKFHLHIPSSNSIIFCCKGQTIRKVTGGGHFQPVLLFFKKFLLVSKIFFNNPLLEFYFFSKNCWRWGGGGGGGGGGG